LEEALAQPAPTGPLLGDELGWAIALLTDKQLTAYRHRRDGHALNWIARRMGVSRARVVHLIGAAEKRLGYAPSVTLKQKTPYKSVARREEERQSTWDAYFNELAAQLEPAERRRLLRIFDSSGTDKELNRRLRKRLSQLQRERRARERGYLPAGAEHDDDWSSAVGQGEAEFYASQAEDGFTHSTGEVLAPTDLVEDDGKGYGRL
jgi:hypothetical protein